MKTIDFPHLNYSDLEREYRQIAAAYPEILNLQKTDIFTDQDVCEYLKISTKTLRKFCRERKIYYLRLGGRYYYIRQLFLSDLLRIYND